MLRQSVSQSVSHEGGSSLVWTRASRSPGGLRPPGPPCFIPVVIVVNVRIQPTAICRGGAKGGLAAPLIRGGQLCVGVLGKGVHHPQIILG